MSGERGVEQYLDGAGRHGGDGLVVRGVEDEALMDVFEQQRAQVELLDDVFDDPSLAPDVGLLQGDGAAGIKMGDKAPADVDGAREAAFQADHAPGARVDPDAAFEAGERLGFHGWRRPRGLGLKSRTTSAGPPVAGWGAGAGRGVAPEHGVGHEFEEIHAHLLGCSVRCGCAAKAAGEASRLLSADVRLRPRG